MLPSHLGCKSRRHSDNVRHLGTASVPRESGERGREGDGDGRRDDRVWEGREEWSKPKRKGGAESGRDLGEGKKGRKIGRKKKRPEGGRKSVQKRSNCDPVVWAGIS